MLRGVAGGRPAGWMVVGGWWRVVVRVLVVRGSWVRGFVVRGSWVHGTAIIACGQVRIACPRDSRRARQEGERARPQSGGIAGRGIRSRAVQGARAPRAEEIPPRLLPDRRVGLPGPAARARHPVLPGGREAADARKGG